MENEQLIPAGELCVSYNVELSFITALTEYGLIEVVTVEGTPCIDKARLKDLERMIRLHYDLDINMEGIDAISHLLRRVDTMQEELNALRNRLKRYEGE
jgi:hypothetical protein